LLHFKPPSIALVLLLLLLLLLLLQFLRVDHEAVAAGLAAVGLSNRAAPADPAAAVAASLTLREENMPLLPGAATDLTDDW
jgi:hypothetical protein